MSSHMDDSRARRSYIEPETEEIPEDEEPSTSVLKEESKPTDEEDIEIVDVDDDEKEEKEEKPAEAPVEDEKVDTEGL